MNFRVELKKLKHRGGTKQYELLYVSNGTLAVCVKRWGKVATWGQVDVVTGSSARCSNEFADKTREKERNGYEIESSNAYGDLNKDEMLAKLGPYRLKLDATVLAYITGGAVGDVVADTASSMLADVPAPKEIGPKTSEHPDWGSW